MTGAEPTDTVRRLLSNEGVLMMKHLLGGVKKGAFTQEEAERRFAAWKQTKDAAVNALQRQNWQTARRSQKANVLKKKKQRTRKG